MVKISRLIVTILIVFAISRLYIYQNPPLYYSDVTADYERYANMWRYGLTPYLEHLYEYPPATIPLLSWPLDLDQAGIGKYYPNYRAQILVIDTVFFLFLLATARKLSWTKDNLMEFSLIYIALTTLGKNFFYEGIDLAFTASITSAVLMPAWIKSNKWYSQLPTWTLFWLSVAIKFFTAPLLLPLAMVINKDFKKTMISIIAGFLIVWGLPLALYRSSLQVMFVHNNNRPIKYASFPSHIIQWANVFSKSETQVQKAPDFEYVGPISTTITKIDKVLFPFAVIAFTFCAGLGLLKEKYFKQAQYSLLKIAQAVQAEIAKPKTLTSNQQILHMLRYFGLYLFLIFLTAKIFSQPFHIWYMPLLVLFPFANKKHRKWAIGLAVLMILLDMTEFLHLNSLRDVKLGVIPFPMIRHSFRFIPMFGMFYLFFKTRGKSLDQAG